jgi:hypothetical protein
MIKIIPYKGWQNNLSLGNGTAELIVTLDVGPRILSYTKNGGFNPLKNNGDQMGGTAEETWKIRGGHRLWAAPENRATTYFPDNAPVAWKQLGGLGLGARVTPPPEKSNGLQKEIDIVLDARGAGVTLTHRITRIAATPVTLAPWALTVMTPGGVCIMPQPSFGEHPRDLLPNRTLVLWPYSDLGDPRWHFGKHHYLLRQDTARGPNKLGLALTAGWAGYAVGGVLFIKKFPWKNGVPYPDGGCNFETFTNAVMLEVESLGPLVTLQPGQTVEHVETWELHDGPDAAAPGFEQALAARLAQQS